MCAASFYLVTLFWFFSFCGFPPYIPFGCRIDQIEKIPLDDIKKELNSAGVSIEAVEQLLQVLSIKSLTELEGWWLI